MPRFPKHAHLVKLDTSLSQYIKYLSSLNNHDKEHQIIYGDSRDVVFFTYRLMTGEKHDLLPSTERIIHEVVDRYHEKEGAKPEKDPSKCREEVFKILHIDDWESPPPGVSPGFVLYCRASTHRHIKAYQRELRDGSKGKGKGKGQLDADSAGIKNSAVTPEQLVQSLCRHVSRDTEEKPLDQMAFYALWDAYLTAQGMTLDAGRCNDLGMWAAQRGTLDGVESDPPPEDS
jgi:hypothetical protein